MSPFLAFIEAPKLGVHAGGTGRSSTAAATSYAALAICGAAIFSYFLLVQPHH